MTNDIDDDEMAIENYRLLSVDSSSRHTGGAAIYVRKDLQIRGTMNFIKERNVWICSVQIKSRLYSGLIAVLYHSPNSSHTTFMDEFNEWCSPIIESGQRIVILGDFNIDWLSNNAESRRIKRIIDDNGLHQRVIEHTRITNNSRTLIDYCITNEKTMSATVSSDNKISDHERITVELSSIDANERNVRKIRFIRNYTAEAMQYELAKCDWKVDNDGDMEMTASKGKRKRQTSVRRSWALMRHGLDIGVLEMCT